VEGGRSGVRCFYFGSGRELFACSDVVGILESRRAFSTNFSLELLFILFLDIRS
jgi:hypothetical protein